ncbi:RDD family protein [Streptomyces sp. PTY087I2]|uniref:RDD family protein n=1 Tax=Streptomyces sp. PTY087I2 TaxID=1819298 RepID=UPI00080B458F|nr:RDD family protein [Streptomyces sp. PTY087I2]OCC07112.1 RDD family protein [Streptomyces sp. PTY087I2]
MSFGDPNNPYGQQPGQPPQGPPQGQPGYGYPQQAPQGVPPQGYGYPQQQPGYPQQPGQPYGAYPQQAGYGQQPGYGGGMPELAHWGLRFGGLIVDGLVMMVPYIFVIIGGAVGDSFGAILSIVGFLALIGVAIWQLYQEGTTGQTVGKKAVGIRLLREADGRPLGFGMAFVRRLAHFLDSLACYIGWLWPLWDEKKQTFADKVCSSVVVKSN